MIDAPGGHPIRVLLIEDDPTAARVVCRVLGEAAGARFEVEWVDLVSSGIDRLAEGGIDVVLLDLVLPDSMGLESLTRIQAQRSMTAVVVVSGLDDESLALQAVQNGAQDYLLKGRYDDQLLIRALRYAVERNRSQRRQAAQHAVTRILAESSTLDDAAFPVLEAMGTKLAWEVGALWLVDRRSQVLHCHKTWHAPGVAAGEFERASLAHECPVGSGLPGRVWAGREPVWITDVAGADEYLRATSAVLSGLHGAFGFPIRIGDDVLGVIEFLSRETRAPDAELLAMMASLGGQIGQFVERKRAEEALRHSEERLRVLFEQMPGVLWTTDTELRFTSSWGTGLGRLNLLPRQSVGQSLFEYFGTVDPGFPPIAAHWRAIGGERVSYEFHWLGLTFQCHVEPLNDREGRTVGCIGVALDVTRYSQVEKALEETKLEMHLAGQIQRGFFPNATHSVPGFDIAGASLPALTAGGDYYDFLPFPDGSIGVVIGDVSGHGLGPALLMASVRAHLHAITATLTDVGQVLTRLNAAFFRDAGGERFVTIVLARLDPASRTFVYSSAGHSTGYVLDHSGTIKSRVESAGFPLGIDCDGEFAVAPPLTLEPGDLVLLLTDGVEDSASPDGTFFGVENALEVVRAHHGSPAREIVSALHGAVIGFSQGLPQRDDITTVVIKVLASEQ